MAEQTFRSQWLDYQGGISRVKALFGSLKNLIELSDEAMNILNSDSVEAAHE